MEHPWSVNLVTYRGLLARPGALDEGVTWVVGVLAAVISRHLAEPATMDSITAVHGQF